LRDIFVDLPLLPKLEFTLVNALLDNIEKYEVLTLTIFFAKDRYTPSNSEHGVVPFVEE
jgi:hypothetical protein